MSSRTEGIKEILREERHVVDTQGHGEPISGRTNAGQRQEAVEERALSRPEREPVRLWERCVCGKAPPASSEGGMSRRCGAVSPRLCRSLSAEILHCGHKKFGSRAVTGSALPSVLLLVRVADEDNDSNKNNSNDATFMECALHAQLPARRYVLVTAHKCPVREVLSLSPFLR